MSRSLHHRPSARCAPPLVSRVAPFSSHFSKDRRSFGREATSAISAMSRAAARAVTSAAWARFAASSASSSSVSHRSSRWLNELRQFGFTRSASRRTRPWTSSRREKRREASPEERPVLHHSFEFLSLTGPRVYDAWSCRPSRRTGRSTTPSPDNTKAT
jgi:hypothetical protein